jgi:hypothetical protein
MPTFAPLKPHHMMDGSGRPDYVEEPLIKRSTFKDPIEQEYLNFLRRAVAEVGNGNTMNSKLDAYGKKHLVTYTGAYPYDAMPKLKHGQSCIVNQDKRGNPGIHWFAVCNDHGRLYGYDSFGRKMDKYIKRNVISDTEDREQLSKEENCGARCLAFLHCYEKYGIDHAMRI